MRSTPSLRSFPNVVFETVPVFVCYEQWGVYYHDASFSLVSGTPPPTPPPHPPSCDNAPVPTATHVSKNNDYDTDRVYV